MNHTEALPTRKLVILGASGSVGSTALEYLQQTPDIALVGLSIHSSVDRLRSILRVQPVSHAAISQSEIYDESISTLIREFPDVNFYRGEDGVLEMMDAAYEEGADTVLTGIVGAAGIRAAIHAIDLSMKVALANKETLVTAAPAIRSRMNRYRGEGKNPTILPVDSEHNAVFQLIEKIHPQHLRRVILTASGGPFFDFPLEDLKSVTRDQVLNHPTWSMGPKITVDSAGMINKGLEMIEAHELFHISYDRLDALIHRKSLVHAMIETSDGGYHMHTSSPHMVFPIASALHYPDPVPRKHDQATAPETWPGIEFYSINQDRYPGYFICLEAGRIGKTAPAIFNAANETAVDLFLNGRIGFTNIPQLIDLVMNDLETEDGVELELFLEADRRARLRTMELSTRFQF